MTNRKLADVKAGDLVTRRYWNRHHYANASHKELEIIVTRTTATMIIVGGGERFYKKDGRMVGHREGGTTVYVGRDRPDPRCRQHAVKLTGSDIVRAKTHGKAIGTRLKPSSDFDEYCVVAD